MHGDAAYRAHLECTTFSSTAQTDRAQKPGVSQEEHRKRWPGPGWKRAREGEDKRRIFRSPEWFADASLLAGFGRKQLVSFLHHWPHLEPLSQCGTPLHGTSTGFRRLSYFLDVNSHCVRLDARTFFWAVRPRPISFYLPLYFLSALHFVVQAGAVPTLMVKAPAKS